MAANLISETPGRCHLSVTQLGVVTSGVILANAQLEASDLDNRIVGKRRGLPSGIDILLVKVQFGPSLPSYTIFFIFQRIHTNLCYSLIQEALL
ncbi:hypothetical protein PV328_004693 [Microctonus aethiopoides]|uniref:Uncharacterized protein n=1 Tax=Microctonus aethiopoides TaxID=144406 RepID=A0AA39KM01_9HYME|nr:hypothetical protein PV328_004693 [Microctonus aethiopoides]